MCGQTTWATVYFILLATINSFQIADFGMSRDLDDADYYLAEAGMIPIKWTAPEVMNEWEL